MTPRIDEAPTRTGFFYAPDTSMPMRLRNALPWATEKAEFNEMLAFSPLIDRSSTTPIV